jgi:uncharacterized membrane protein YhaH (DUF805 family)
MMGLWESIQTCFQKYFVFSGRARRSEFWWFLLFAILMRIGLGFVDSAVFHTPDQVVANGTGFFEAFAIGYENTTNGVLTGIFNLAVFIPNLAVTSRRLHDTGRSGWWQILPLVLLFVVGVIMGVAALSSYSAMGDSGVSLFVTVVCVLAVLISVVVLIVWLASRGTKGSNFFGEDPVQSLEPNRA